MHPVAEDVYQSERVKKDNKLLSLSCEGKFIFKNSQCFCVLSKRIE